MRLNPPRPVLHNLPDFIKFFLSPNLPIAFFQSPEFLKHKPYAVALYLFYDGYDSVKPDLRIVCPVKPADMPN